MSTTATPDTISEIDVDTFVRLLADEPELPCGTTGCDEPARWTTQCGWCASDVHVCDRCRGKIDHAAWHGYDVRCKVTRGDRKCAWRFPSPIPWRPL